MAGDKAFTVEGMIELVGGEKAVKQLESVGTAAKKTSKGLSTEFKGLGGVLAAAGVGALLMDAARAAVVAQESTAKLAASVKASGGDWEAYRDRVDDVVQSTSKLAAVDDEDLQDAMRSLIQITGSTDRAMGLLALTTDFAAGTGKNLASSAMIVGKVANGNYTQLNRLGIKLGETATAQDYLNEMMKRFGGSAAAYAETAAGKMAAATVAIENAKETIGESFLPVIADTAEGVAGLAETFSGLPPDIQAVTVEVVALGAALKASFGGIGILVALGWEWSRFMANMSVAARDFLLEAVGLIDWYEDLEDSIEGAIPFLKQWNAYWQYDALDRHAGMAEAAAVATDGLTGSVDNATGSVRDFTGALEDEYAVLQDAPNVLTVMQQGQLDLANAQIAAQRAQKNYNDALAEYGAGSPQVIAASLQLLEANKRVTEQTGQASAATQETINKMAGLSAAEWDAAIASGGLSASEVAAVEALRNAQGAASGASGKFSAAAGTASDLGGAIASIPENTTVSLTTQVKRDTLDRLLKDISVPYMVTLITQVKGEKPPKFAEGGYFTRPTYGLFGEAGPEYIINPKQPNAPSLIAGAAKDAGIGLGDLTLNLAIDLGDAVRTLTKRIQRDDIRDGAFAGRLAL